MTITPLVFTGGDMSHALTSQAIYSTQLACSIQLSWPSTGSPVGTIGVEVSSDGVKWDTVSFATADVTVTQPTGTAGSTTINLSDFYEPYIHVIYTPTSGGTGAALAGNITLK
jgi:hypothetical protein